MMKYGNATQGTCTVMLSSSQWQRELLSGAGRMNRHYWNSLALWFLYEPSLSHVFISQHHTVSSLQPSMLCWVHTRHMAPPRPAAPSATAQMASATVNTQWVLSWITSQHSEALKHLQLSPVTAYTGYQWTLIPMWRYHGSN